VEESNIVEAPQLYILRVKTTPKVLAFRARKLKITLEELHQCKTLAEIKALAKKKYYALARIHHPDHRRNGFWNGYGRCEKRGSAFRQLTKTYHWFIALTEKDLVHKSAYPTVQEIPMPWHMERAPLHLPSGYNESFDHLAYD
jgi:hypothetical protein